MVLGFNASVVNEDAGITYNSTHGTTAVGIDLNFDYGTRSDTSTSFSDLEGSMRIEGNFFSTPKTTPSLVLTPIAVAPNFNQFLLTHKSTNVYLLLLLQWRIQSDRFCLLEKKC